MVEAISDRVARNNQVLSDDETLFLLGLETW